MANNLQILPSEFIKIKDNKEVFLLDVRTPDEFNIVNLGGVLIPNYELLNRIDEIPKDKEIIVMCHHGIRSMQIVNILLAHNYSKVKNLSGGIDKYAIDVDTSLARY